ncbi:MAG: DUF4134 family protein [Bacteroidota bacterium]
MNNKIKFILTLALIIPFHALFADNDPDIFRGVDQATEGIRTNYPKIRNFLWVLSGLVAAYGAFKVYTKFQNNDQDTTKAAGVYFCGFIFLLVSGFIINGSFIN